MSLVYTLYAFRCCDDGHEFDVLSAVLLDEVKSCDSRSASSKHRIGNNNQSFLDWIRKFEVVTVWLVSLLLPISSNLS